MIIIQANNIHSGGGAVLLKNLLNELNSAQHKAIVFVDQRLDIKQDDLKLIEFHRIKPTILHRLYSEYLIYSLNKKFLSKDDLYLFFGNLPPIFQITSKTILFFQNNIVLDSHFIMQFPIKTAIQMYIQKLWIHIFIKNIDRVVVQSDSTCQIFKNKFPTINTEVCAFSDSEFRSNHHLNREYDFIYVASFVPHKNHIELLRAWEHLVSQNLLKTLVLVTDKKEELERTVNLYCVKSRYLITILTELDRSGIEILYAKSNVLIFPSLTESMGLPLIEAKSMGLDIIASELDYVRDLLDPVETFNPKSYISISRAVMRYFKINECKTQIKSTSDFLSYLKGLKI